MSATETTRANGRYDALVRHRMKRSGKEQGGWVYVPAEELDKTGYGHGQDAPFYRVWGQTRGGVLVRLYREA